MNNYSDTAMSRVHPIVILIYICSMLLVSCLTLNMYILSISLFTASVIYVLYRGWTSLIKMLCYSIFIAIFMVLIQPLFNHTGSTIVFYINDNPVYVENYIYGGVVWILLLTCMLWFGVAQVMIDSERLLYLVGRFAPGIAMTLAMIFRFIPLMKRRYKQIHEAQLGMGRGCTEGSIIGMGERIRYNMKELSILVSWSLESSMEMSLSMENREYGTKKRTQYVRFKVRRADIVSGVAIVCLLAIVLTAVFGKCYAIYYLPVMYVTSLNCLGVVGLIALALLGLYPLMPEMKQICSGGLFKIRLNTRSRSR